MFRRLWKGMNGKGRRGELCDVPKQDGVADGHSQRRTLCAPIGQRQALGYSNCR